MQEHSDLMDELRERKDRMKALWALGDYPAIARRLEPAAAALVAACGIGDGTRVLDVAAGNGNVAAVAARAGADVTASDFAPVMVAAGQARTEALGLDVRWDEADAEDLPYADEAFDVVLSAFGIIFAAQPEVAAEECFRVLRRGGVLGLTAWTPDGFTGQVTELLGQHLPAPMGAARPVEWGIEAIVRQRLAAHAGDVTMTRDAVAWDFPSVADCIGWQERNFGALIAARAQLGQRYAELRADLGRLIEEWNRAADGRVKLPASYLLAIARRAR
jgi:SAM-dependent methyltransferase